MAWDYQLGQGETLQVQLDFSEVSCKQAAGHATTSAAGASLHSINITASDSDLNPLFSGLTNISLLQSGTVSIGQVDKNLPKNTHGPGA